MVQEPLLQILSGPIHGGELGNDAFGTGRLAKELLPKILITDPAIQVIKEMEETENDELPAGWLANRVVKVVRYSRSAGNSVAFRLIVESA
jgi:DNA-directed RNA polymerase subunit H (RpoH/RPB5)